MHSTTIKEESPAFFSPSLHHHSISSSLHLSSPPPVMPLFLPNREWISPSFHFIFVHFIGIYFFFCFAFVVILMAQALFCLFLFSKATSLNVHLHSVLVWGLGVGSKALQRISGLCILSCTVILWMKCKLFVPFPSYQYWSCKPPPFFWFGNA